MGSAISLPADIYTITKVGKKKWRTWKQVQVKDTCDRSNDSDHNALDSQSKLDKKRMPKTSVKNIALFQHYHKVENFSSTWKTTNGTDGCESESVMSTATSNVLSPSDHSTKKLTKPSLRVVISEDDSESTGMSLNKRANGVTTVGRRVNSTVYVGPLAICERGIEVTRCMTNGAQLPHPHSFLAKGRLDFVHIGKLGSGNSGSVIEALHVPTLTIVALKMLPVYDEKDLSLISNELSVLCQNLAELKLMDERLGVHSGDMASARSPRCSMWCTIDEEDDEGSAKHPEIISPCPQLLAMYDAFLDPLSGMVNLVVEYMDGGSLQDMVNSGGCQDEEVIADIAHQVLLGLDFLHCHNQMHRDIKPGNILLNCDGQVKLADFGISKAMSPLATRQSKQDFIGTVCYMAPERIQNKEYSFPSDIWSFGMTLLAVIHGRYPLVNTQGKAAKDYWDLLRLICEEDVPMPGCEFSNEFNGFIKSCVEKKSVCRATVRGLLNGKFFEKHSAVICCDEAPEGCRSRAMSGTDDDAPGTLNPREPSCMGLVNPRAPSYRTTLQPRVSSHLDGRSPSGRGAPRVGSTRYMHQGSSRMRLSLLTSRSTALLKGSTNKSICGDDMISTYIDSHDDGYLYAMRLEHLKKVLEKTSVMFDRTASLSNARKNMKSQSKYSIDESVDQFVLENYSYDFDYYKPAVVPSVCNSDNNTNHRTLSRSRSLVRRNTSLAEHLCKLPCSTFGRARWQHLAQQLYLPYDVVISTAKGIVNIEHFETAEEHKNKLYRG